MWFSDHSHANWWNQKTYLKGGEAKSFYHMCNTISIRSIKKALALSNFNFRNNGSVRELYLLHVTIRPVRFCSLSNLPNLKPRAEIEYCRCGKIKELYKMRRTCVGRKFFRRHLIPRGGSSDFIRNFQCEWFPAKMLVDCKSEEVKFACFVYCFWIFLESWCDIVHIVLIMGKIKNLFFSTFNNNLFIFNHSCIWAEV